MARACAVCGKESMGGFNPQSSGMNRVRAHRRYQPNLQQLVVVSQTGEAKTEIKPKAKSEAKTRVKAESKKAATSKAEVVETPDEEKTEAAKPAKRATRKKETE